MGFVRLVILLFSILLMTQSIFGSPFKQDHDKRSLGSSSKGTEVQRRHGSSSISAFKEEEEKYKRGNSTVKIAAGVIIEGTLLGLEILNTILDTLGNINRKVAIGVDNESGYEWEAINVYFSSGTSDDVLPMEVPSGKALLYGARKTSGPVATGVVGVFTYYIRDIHKTLAVMFSIPFDYNLYSNWFDAQVYSGKIWADHGLYEQMYYDDPFRGNNGWHERNLQSPLKMKGAMSSSGQATVLIHIRKQ